MARQSSAAAGRLGVAPATHSPSSRFQIGASALIRSMISRAPANASARCGADAAITTDGLRQRAQCRSGARRRRRTGRGARPPRATIAAICCSAISTYASYSSAGTSRVTPLKLTIAPARGSATSASSGSSRKRLAGDAHAAAPLRRHRTTGGISASSSPGASGVSGAAYSRLTAITTRTPPVSQLNCDEGVGDPRAVRQLELDRDRPRLARADRRTGGT